MSHLGLVSLLLAVCLQFYYVQPAKDFKGQCPPRKIGTCLCPDRINNSTDELHIPGFTNVTAKDTCQSDENCKSTEKCCQSGCCGYKRCISVGRANVRPVKHYGTCPSREGSACLCPDRVNNSTMEHDHNETIGHHNETNVHHHHHNGTAGHQNGTFGHHNGTVNHHNGTVVFTNTSSFKSNSKDTCRSDSDCEVTQKCCKSGCCGYRKCVESIKDTADQCTRENEEYKKCGSLCYPTCENKARPIACPLVCKGGCFCKSGYLRRSDGECVQQNDCRPL